MGTHRGDIRSEGLRPRLRKYPTESADFRVWAPTRFFPFFSSVTIVASEDLSIGISQINIREHNHASDTTQKTEHRQSRRCPVCTSDDFRHWASPWRRWRAPQET